MAINFTDSPADGATQVIGGRTYTYNSAKNKWDTTATEVVGPTATVYATVDNLPGTATTGDQAFVSGTNRLYIWNGSGWYNIALINTNPTISGVSSSYALATDGTATTVTITATDPEGLPITYSLLSDTSGSIATVTQGTGASSNVFTITPSTSAANAGTFSLTFRASDGVNIASSIASFTLEFKVVNSNYTTALVTSVGANNATNSLVADNSTNDYGFALYGTNSTQGTFSPYRHGGYSTYFDTTAHYITVPYSSTLDFGSNDFTIEWWMHPTTTAGDQNIFSMSNNLGIYGPLWVRYNGGVLKAWATTANGTFNIFNSTTISGSIPANEWTHVAITRTSAGVWTTYLNGVSSYTSTAAGSLYVNSNNTEIGGSSTANFDFRGYIADFRMVNGTVVYTSGFTPPEERLEAITNTSLLWGHTYRITDGSTNAHDLTVTGTISAAPFAPYDSQTYTTADHGSSYYFGGLGNHVASTSGTGVAAPGGGDFCLEFWVYPTNSGVSCLFDYRPYNANPASSLLLFKDASNRPYLYANLGQRILATDAIPVNAWSHVAVTRNNGTHYLYVNGKQQSGTWADSTTWTTDAYRPIFMQSGFHAAGNSAGNYYNTTGHMTDIRLVTGSSVYTTDFTPSTSPLTAITNTELLLNAERAGIIDKSQSIKTITLSGGTVSSTSQTKYLSSSIKFDGVDDQITIPQVNIGASQDFTIECWHYLTSRVDLYPALFGNYNSFTTGALSLFVGHNNSTTTSYQVAHNGTFPFINAGTINYNQWVHVALVRSGTTMTLYIDGTSVGSGTSSVALNGVGNDFFIGRIGDNASGHIEGYISDFRITKGLARYTANFTPPTAELKG